MRGVGQGRVKLGRRVSQMLNLRFQIGACTPRHTPPRPLRTARTKASVPSTARTKALVPSTARTRASVPSTAHTRASVPSSMGTGASMPRHVSCWAKSWWSQTRYPWPSVATKLKRTPKQPGGSARENRPLQVGKTCAGCLRASGVRVILASRWDRIPAAIKGHPTAWQMKHPFCGLRASRSGSRR